jgi:uncharacterized protein YidB (DUF937 family)
LNFLGSTKGKNMFEVLIREAVARFGVGDKALPLVQMLLAAITSKDTGGLAGFLEKFKAAGLGPLVQSWLGGGAGAQLISNAQVETVLGASGGLLPALTTHLGLPRDKVTEAIGYLLPALVGRLTPGGSLPANLPAEIASYAQAGQGLLTQAIQRTDAGGNNRKWRLGAIVLIIVIVLAAWYSWDTSRHASLPDTAQPNPLANTQPPIPGVTFGGAPAQPASAAAPAASTPPGATSAPASAAH